MKKTKTIIFWLGIVLFLFWTSFVYVKHLATFSFVDEFNNFMVPYFMYKGRHVYTEIFLNHQMLAVYVSAIIQQIIHPGSLFQLIAVHRLFVVTYAFAWNIFFILRFKKIGLGFVVFFELMKYYFFGHLFLAETFIVYPLVYMSGVVFEYLFTKRLYSIEVFISAFLTWFVVFMREPFIPLVLCIFAMLLYCSKKEKQRMWVWAAGVFILFSFMILSVQPLSEYVFSIVQVNKESVADAEFAAQGNMLISVLKSFLYPLLAIIRPEHSRMQVILALLSILYYGLIVRLRKKNKSVVIFSFLVLGLAAIRMVPPGDVYFHAYRMLPWIALCIFSICFFVRQENKKTQAFSIFVLGIALSLLMFDRNAFIWEKRNVQADFQMNYAGHFLVGEVSRLLTQPNDTLFVNDYDSIGFWQSGLDSSYKFALYYPVMIQFPKYFNEREKMFREYPPTFYDAADCHPETNTGLPSGAEHNFVGLRKNGEKTCFFVRKDAALKISDQQWESIKQYGFEKPSL